MYFNFSQSLDLDCTFFSEKDINIVSVTYKEQMCIYTYMYFENNFFKYNHMTIEDIFSFQFTYICLVFSLS